MLGDEHNVPFPTNKTFLSPECPPLGRSWEDTCPCSEQLTNQMGRLSHHLPFQELLDYEGSGSQGVRGWGTQGLRTESLQRQGEHADRNSVKEAVTPLHVQLTELGRNSVYEQR